MMSKTPRLLAVTALAASLIFAGCSNKSDDEGKKPEVSAENKEFCETVRDAMNAPTSEEVDAVKAQLAAAPEELKADYKMVVEFLEYRAENPADAAGIQERKEKMNPAFQRLLSQVEEMCGFNPFVL